MRTPHNHSRIGKIEAMTGVCCLLAGLVAPLIAGLLSLFVWMAGGVHPWANLVSSALFIGAIPLILFAGFWLDWAERDQKRAAIDRERIKSRESGLIQTIVIACVLGIGVLNPETSVAQQTIFNVPSTDVLEKGKVYAELDASLKPTDGSLISKFSSFVPRVVVGAGRRVEIGLNITGNIQPGPDSTTLVPTIKWKPYQGEDNGWAFVIGDNLFVPVRNRGYNAGNYVYVEASKTFASGTRITFGGYDFTRNVVAAANRAGGQFGFEQPLNKKVTFAADWFTGNHAAGYFTPGVVLKVGPAVTGYAGYSLGNQNISKGNHFFLLELGYNFN